MKLPSVIANLRQWSLLFGNFSIVSHLTWCSVPPTFSTTVSLPTEKCLNAHCRVNFLIVKRTLICYWSEFVNSTSSYHICLSVSPHFFSGKGWKIKDWVVRTFFCWQNLTVVLLINILVPRVNIITAILSHQRIYFIYGALHHFSSIELKYLSTSLLETPGFSWFDSYVI